MTVLDGDVVVRVDVRVRDEELDIDVEVETDPDPLVGRTGGAAVDSGGQV